MEGQSVWCTYEITDALQGMPSGFKYTFVWSGDNSQALVNAEQKWVNEHKK